MSSVKTKIIIDQIKKNLKPIFNLIDSIKRILSYISGGKNEMLFDTFNSINEELISNIATILKKISTQKFIYYQKTYNPNCNLSFPKKIIPKLKQTISLTLQTSNNIFYSPDDFVIVVSDDLSKKNFFKGLVQNYDPDLNIINIYNIFFIKGDDYDSFITYKIYLDYSYIYNFSVPYVSPEIPIYTFNLSYFFKTNYKIIQINNQNILTPEISDIFNDDIFNIYGPTFLTNKISEFEEKLFILENMYNAL